MMTDLNGAKRRAGELFSPAEQRESSADDRDDQADRRDLELDARESRTDAREAFQDDRERKTQQILTRALERDSMPTNVTRLRTSVTGPPTSTGSCTRTTDPKPTTRQPIERGCRRLMTGRTPSATETPPPKTDRSSLRMTTTRWPDAG